MITVAFSALFYLAAAVLTVGILHRIVGICASRTGAASGCGRGAYQRHRGLLGLRQKSPGEVPWHE